jgi:hypothetical protein
MNGGASASSRVEIILEVFYDPADHSISLVTDDPRLTDENRERPGFRVTFNGNPKSADYNPANLNRLARLLCDNGQPAPAEVPVKKRQLSLRSKVIAELTAESVRATGKPADPSVFGWTTCPACSAVVVDVERHRTATSC